MDWTEERIAELKRLWSEGYSASQIAERLGGITRNAVIGKAHRLHLPSRPSPIQRQMGERRMRSRTVMRPAAIRAAAPEVMRAQAPAVVVARPAPPPPPKPVRGGPIDYSTALSLTDRHCHWPIGHPNEPGFHFCGAPSAAGRPYCSAHCQVAYRKTDDAAA
ncbi:MAG: GcrA cell cycle regulator [Alphaproteobacteria bacterium]|nr:GcrA cell cycle regulator [Alphaproteobacteria bacterium]